MDIKSERRPDPNDPRKRTKLVRLVSLIVLCSLPLWIMMVFQIYEDYRARQAALLDHTSGMAQALTLTVETKLKGVNAALLALATSPAFDDGDLETIYRQANEVLEFYPGSLIAVADSTDHLLIDTSRPPGEPLYREPLRLPMRPVPMDGDLKVSDMFRALVSRRFQIVLSVPVRRSGKDVYRLGMALPSTQIGKMLFDQNLPDQWTVSILDGNGASFITSRDGRYVIGQPVSAALKTAIAENKQGMIPEKGGNDGTIYTFFDRSALSGWATVISVPDKLYRDELMWAIIPGLLGVLFSSGIAIAVATLIARRILEAGRKLQESETRFGSLADSLQAFVWVANVQGNRYWFNKTWLEATGLTLEESQGWGWTKTVHPEDRERAVAEMERSVREQIPNRCEYRLMCHDGSILWLLSSLSLRRAADGTLLGFIGTAIDISERKKAELELKRYSEIVETTDDLLAFIDTTLHYGLVNTAYARMVSLPPESIKGRSVREVLGDDLFRASRAGLEQTLAGKETRHRIERVFADGRRRTLEVDYRPFRVNGAVQGIVASLRDITERVVAERELTIAAVAFEIQEGIVITDAKGMIIRVNRAFMRETGFSARELLGKSPTMLISPRHGGDELEQGLDHLFRDESWHGELWCRRKNATEFPILLTISTVTDGKGSVSHFVGAFLNITERKAAEEKILNLAFFDTLTGLPNRRLLLDRLRRAILSSKRSGHHGAVLFIDLDNFKFLNDTRGHDVGDLLLIEVARRLESCVRDVDTVARLGGDEFVVVLENLDGTETEAARQCRKVGEKILLALNEPYHLEGAPYRSSSSIGAALFLGQKKSEGELLKQADMAMYQAKAAGRNRLFFFAPGMHPVDPNEDPAPDPKTG